MLAADIEISFGRKNAKKNTAADEAEKAFLQINKVPEIK